MNILMTAGSFYPAQEGGPSNAQYWLASGLVRSGQKVVMITTDRYINDPRIEFDKWTEVNGIQVIYKRTRHYKLAPNIFALKKIDDNDVVITNGVCFFPSYLLNAAALLKKKKVLISPRGELFDSAIYLKGPVSGFLKKLFFRLLRLTYGRRVIYHATCEEEVEAIKKIMGRKSRVGMIPNYMILPPKLDHAASQKEPYLLFVGRLNPIKSIDKLILGLSRSAGFMNSLMKLWIAGEKKGDYYQSLLKLVDELHMQEKVRFLGLVTGTDKDRLYANAKCLMLVSQSENFGNVVIEALAQGTPAITSQGTPWQMLPEQGAGYWIDATPENIARSVDKMLTLDTAAYARMRECSLKLSKNFDIYSHLDSWVKLLS